MSYWDWLPPEMHECIMDVTREIKRRVWVDVHVELLLATANVRRCLEFNLFSERQRHVRVPDPRALQNTFSLSPGVRYTVLRNPMHGWVVGVRGGVAQWGVPLALEWQLATRDCF